MMGRLRQAVLGVAVAIALSSASAAHGAIVVPDGGVAIKGSTADIKRGVDVAHAAGARWISLGASWGAMEPDPDGYMTPGSPGAAAWADLEDRLAYAKARGMNVHIVFTDAPGWASGHTGTNDPPTPANRQAYGSFLTDLARRLGPYLDAYSPWNEPNIAGFWTPVDPVAYVELQKVAYQAIKSADPTATVLSAPISGSKGNINPQDRYGNTYLRQAYQAGLRGSVDAIAWTAYPIAEPEVAYNDENGVPAGSSLPGQLHLRDLINQFDPGRKVWIMELSWSTCTPSCNFFPGNSVTEAQQADYLVRAFEYRRRHLAGITERMFWFQLADSGTDPRRWQNHQGLLRFDLTPKPALAAFTSIGFEETTGAPATPVGGRPGSPGTTTVGGLPVAATRLKLPTKVASRSKRVVLGRPRLIVRRGVFRLTLKVAVRGGTSRVRFDGFRGRKWRHITTTRVRRSGTLRLRFPDKAYVSIRVRATVPGKPGFRAGRLVRVPAKYVRARGIRR